MVEGRDEKRRGGSSGTSSPTSDCRPVPGPVMEDSRQYRLVLLGAGQTGKTSLVWRFMHGNFLSRYHPTVEDSYRHLIQLPDGRYKVVEILDTAGMHQFPAMRELSIKSGQAFVVVYAVNNRPSFNEALNLISLITKIKPSGGYPMILVGNKQDLTSDQRQVSTEEGALMAVENNCAFAETSAFQDINVNDLFLQLFYRGFQYVQPAVDPSATPGSRRRVLTSRSRRRLGRSKSAGIMSVGESERIMNVEMGKKCLITKHSVLEKSSTRELSFYDDNQARCVIL